MKQPLATTCCVLGLVCLLPQIAGANEIIGRMFWSQLKNYETEALRDYSSNNISNDVLALSDNLWSLSSDAVVSAEYEPCRVAARTLSMMVAGSYWSAKANQVALDWHAYAANYADNRKSCLKALKYDERDYQLPMWFGR